MTTSSSSTAFDLKDAFTENRLVGLWRMMTGFRWVYLGATTSQAISATSKTLTYLLLRYFVDHVLGKSEASHLLPWIALGFVGLAVFEGSFSFMTGRLAARTAEGIALRLRNYL